MDMRLRIAIIIGPVFLMLLARSSPTLPRGLDTPLGGSSETTIAVDPNDPMRVAYASVKELRVSTDGGATWQPPVRPRVPVTHRAGFDPSIAFDSQGRLFWTYLGYAIDLGAYAAVQFDFFIAQCDPTTGAILDGYPVNVTESVGLPQDADKQWLAIDTFPSSPFADRLYVAWIDFQGGGAGTHVRTSFSTDQGMTWSSEVTHGMDPALGHVWPPHNAVAPNGDVYLAFHAQPGWQPENDGISGQILVSRSTDGGVTFQPPTLAFQPGAADVSDNRQHLDGPIAGARFLTRGSRQGWILPAPTPGRVHVVACDDPDNVHASGDDANVYIVTSNDHGATWSAPTRVDDGPGDTFQVMPTAAIDPWTGAIAVQYLDNRNGAVNEHGSYLLDVFATMSLDGGVTFTPGVQINDAPFDPDLAAWCALRCGTGLRGVWAISPNDVFAVGDDGTILHYDGSSWSLQASGTGLPLFGVWGSGTDDVFVVGRSGTIRRYNGTFWGFQLTGTTVLLHAVWGTGPDDVFAVGGDGTILHYDGTSWSPQASGTTAALSGVWAAAPGDVFAVGESGTILHYDGTSWSPQASGTDEPLYKVWGSAGNDVFAVGWQGSILHYDGVSWSPQLSEPGREFSAVWGSSATDVFAVDSRGDILHYDGSAWSVMRPGNWLLGLGGSSNADVFAVGSRVASYGILHYDGTAWTPQDNPLVPTDRTLRIGEYNGVAVRAIGPGLLDVVGMTVWSETWSIDGIPSEQQAIFDRVTLGTVGIDGPAAGPTSVRSLVLGQNRPNPFRAQTSIQFELDAAEHVLLRVYDVDGRLVRTLLGEQMAVGSHAVEWDGQDDQGHDVASGIYWYRLEVGDRVESKRLVLMH